jgi:hypothetical protein
VLKEHRNTLSAEGISAKSGRQTTARIGDQRSSGQRCRPKGCKGWAASWEQFKPTLLASLQNAKGVGEGKSEAVAKQTGLGSSIVEKFGHGMVRVKDKVWWAMGGEQMQASTKLAGKRGGENRLGSEFDGSCGRGGKKEQASKATQHLAGQASEATQHLAGATQHLAGQADKATRHLAGQTGKATQHLAGQASEATQHLAGQASEATQHLAGATPHWAGQTTKQQWTGGC